MNVVNLIRCHLLVYEACSILQSILTSVVPFDRSPDVRVAVCSVLPHLLVAYSVMLRDPEVILILALGGKLTLPMFLAFQECVLLPLSLAVVLFHVLCASWASQPVDSCSSSLCSFLKLFLVFSSLLFSLLCM